MPAFQPAPSPRFSPSSTRTSAKSSRTTSGVPSLEPLSTTIVSSPRTLARQCSIQGSALYVTTRTLTVVGALGMRRVRATPQPLPEQDHAARQRHRDRDEEEEESRGERLVGADSE